VLLIVEAFMASLNVAVTEMPELILIDQFGGETDTTTGGVVSAFAEKLNNIIARINDT